MRKLLSILLLLPTAILAQRDWSSVQIERTEVNNRISFLVGSGGNVGVLIGDEGVMIVDDQYAPLSEKIQAAIAEISSGQIRYTLNTHYHGDHTGGNENFKEAGAIVVAQDNVRDRLGKSWTNEILGRDMEAKSESFWPVITFSDEMTFHFNGEEVTLMYAPNAHTDGDALVHFKTSNIIHAGDLFVRYGYPFIDVSAGGTIDGMIAAQKKILSLCDDNTQIIPGHGQLSTKKDVQELLNMLEATKAIVTKAKEKGETLEDLMAREPLQDFHDRWNGSFITSDLFVQIIYETVE